MTGGKFIAPLVLAAAVHVLYFQEFDSAGNRSAKASKEIALAPREIVGKAGFSAGAAQTTSTSLALNSTGAPFIAFGDGANEGEITVMKTSFDP